MVKRRSARRSNLRSQDRKDDTTIGSSGWLFDLLGKTACAPHAGDGGPRPWRSAIAGLTRPKLLFAGAGSAVLLGLLAGCTGGVLDPRGPIGAADDKILFNALGIMLLIVVPTIVAALVFAWWFRASNTKSRYEPQWSYSGRIEIVSWAIPLLVILFLGGVIWIGSHELDPYRPIAPHRKPLQVQVVSLDWKWLFIYPDQGIASVNRLVVPAGEPVHFSLTSATVMNSFFVPQLGSMIATMYGMVTQLYLEADHAGDFYGESAQFSGDGFSDMHFTLHAAPADAFARWVATARKTGPALDRAGYIALLRETQNTRPFTYKAVEPGLFGAIVTGQLPSGPGPSEGAAGPSVRPVGAK